MINLYIHPLVFLIVLRQVESSSSHIFISPFADPENKIPVQNFEDLIEVMSAECASRIFVSRIIFSNAPFLYYSL